MNTESTETSLFDMATRHLLAGAALLSPLVFFPFIHNISNLPKTTIVQFCLCLTFFLWSVKTLKFNLPIIRHPALLPLGLWLFFSGISIFWAIDWFSGATLWVHWTICALAFPVIINTMKDMTGPDYLMHCCAIGASIISVIACLQYIFDITLIPQAVVPGGTFFNRNVMAQYLVMIFPISILLFLLNKKKYLHGVYALMYVLQMVGLLYTKTRAAWLALLLSIPAIILVIFLSGFFKEIKHFLPKEKAGYLAGSILLILLLANIPQSVNQAVHTTGNPARVTGTAPKKNTQKTHIQQKGPKTSYKSTLLSIAEHNEGSGSVRLDMWINSFSMLKDYFLTGTGLGNFYIHYPKYHADLKTDKVFSLNHQPTHLHNDFLQIMLETTPAGLLAFSGIILIVFLRSLTAFRLSETPETKLRILFLGMAICTFSIDAFFSFPLRMALPPFYLMLILGMMAVIDISVCGSSFEKPLFFRKTGKVILPLIAFLFFLSSGYVNMRRISADHHYLRSAYYNAGKKWDFAAKEAEKSVNLIPWRYPPWYERAQAYEHLGLLDESIDAYEKTLKIHPFLINSQLKLSSAYLKKHQIKKSEYWIDKALALMPNLGLALYQKGLIRERLGNTGQAEFYYRKVSAVSPNFAEAYYRLGIINLKNNKIKTSEYQLEKALSLKPNLKKIHFQLGNVYTKLNRFDDAAEAFKKELRLRPRNSNAYTGLGLVYAKQQKWEDAISAFKKAIRLNPNSGEAHMNIAVTYFYTKDYDLSLEHADIAEELKIPQAATLKKRLAQAMGDF